MKKAISLVLTLVLVLALTPSASALASGTVGGGIFAQPVEVTVAPNYYYDYYSPYYYGGYYYDYTVTQLPYTLASGTVGNGIFGEKIVYEVADSVATYYPYNYSYNNWYGYYGYYDAGSYAVTASALNYRTAPGTDGAIKGSLGNGAIINVTGFSANGKWASTVIGGDVVWMYTQYLTPVGYYGYDYYPYYYGASYSLYDYPYMNNYNYFYPYSYYYNDYTGYTYAGGTYTVAAYPYAIVYAGLGTSYNIVGAIATGDVVYVDNIVNGWGQISYKGLVAYVSMVDLY